MKYLLGAALATAVTVSGAQAAIISYEFASPIVMDLQYSSGFFDGGDEAVDMPELVRPTRTLPVQHIFTIDTDKLVGNSFSFRGFGGDDPSTYLPAGVSISHDDLQFGYRASFDDEWNLVDLDAWFGTGATTYGFGLDNATWASDFAEVTYDENGTKFFHSWGYSAGGTMPIVKTVEDVPAPVPLPASGLLLVAALGGFGMIRRIRR